MGLPAARLTDPTAHGTPLGPGPGCPTVLIGSLPAWRSIADFHVCPAATGLVPHLGGVVEMGSTTVLIGGLPAARMTDLVQEAGGPNPIMSGCPTVLIG
jgi:uncharacterized Zn-binding protein involved in type VI secretion